MTRALRAFAVLLLLVARPLHAAPSDCRYGGDLAQWTASMVRQARYVLLGRITAVIAPTADHAAQLAVLDVKTPLKGSLHFNRVWNARAGVTFYPLLGELRVFFVDDQRALVGCSDYPGEETEQVLREVERALRGSAT